MGHNHRGSLRFTLLWGSGMLEWNDGAGSVGGASWTTSGCRYDRVKYSK